MRAGIAWCGGSLLMLSLLACKPQAGEAEKARGLKAFATVEQVFQHPRCSNCHVPGDQPLQFDSQTPHMMRVVRGPEGQGTPDLACTSCHGEANPPTGFSAHAAPGAPHWAMPPPQQKMAWLGVPTAELCAMIQDRKRNGDRDLAAMLHHVSEDRLVLWGWNPGGNRVPVPVPHEQFVASFKTWMEAGAPCG